MYTHLTDKWLRAGQLITPNLYRSKARDPHSHLTDDSSSYYIRAAERIKRTAHTRGASLELIVCTHLEWIVSWIQHICVQKYTGRVSVLVCAYHSVLIAQDTLILKASKGCKMLTTKTSDHNIIYHNIS